MTLTSFCSSDQILDHFMNSEEGKKIEKIYQVKPKIYQDLIKT